MVFVECLDQLKYTLSCSVSSFHAKSFLFFLWFFRIIFFKRSSQCQCPKQPVRRPRQQVAWASWPSGSDCWSVCRQQTMASRVSLKWPESWSCWLTWRRIDGTRCSPFTTSASALPANHTSSPTVRKKAEVKCYNCLQTQVVWESCRVMLLALPPCYKPNMSESNVLTYCSLQ